VTAPVATIRADRCHQHPACVLIRARSTGLLVRLELHLPGDLALRLARGILALLTSSAPIPQSRPNSGGST
jgi:hypothetical protein